MEAIKKEPLQSIALLLIRQNLLNREQALNYQSDAANSKFGFIHYLVKKHHFCAKTIAQCIAQQFGMPFVEIDRVDINSIPTHFINENLLSKHLIVPLFKRDHQLYVAIDDPNHPSVIKEIQFHSGLQVIPLIAESDKLHALIERLLEQKEHRDLTHYYTSTSITAEFKSAEGLLSKDDTPVIKFVNRILQTAVEKGASDIHFEPYADIYQIRYRLDGLLHVIATPPINLASRVAARIKIMANLDISERRIPQDGRMKINTTPYPMDCRINTCPTLHGEKIVVRILNSTLAKCNLGHLSLYAQQQAIFLQALERPQGMILVTGPTGSGKTTTLYSALNHLNTGTQNISTIEDPIEMDVFGINQINVNPKIGLDFTSLLRSLLRQDPDVIMIGEIRDINTAEIAVHAAQTGHLVLSTLHANNAIDTLLRLRNMGISSVNFAHSVKLVIAQRLVRRLCEHCKCIRTDLSNQELSMLGLTNLEATPFPTYAANGCILCTQGYNGRIALYEFLPISQQIVHMISSDVQRLELHKQAQLEGMQTLYQIALEKIKEGLTTIEEVKRVMTDE